MNGDAVGGETSVGIGAGQRHELAGLVPCEQDARLFEQFSSGGDVISRSLDRRHSRELRAGVSQAVAPRVVHIAIAGVYAATRKHVRAAHEGRVHVPADHEDLGS